MLDVAVDMLLVPANRKRRSTLRATSSDFIDKSVYITTFWKTRRGHHESDAQKLEGVANDK